MSKCLLHSAVSYLTFSLHHCHRHSCLGIKQALYTWRTNWLNSKTACWQTMGKQPFEWRSNCHFLLSTLIYQRPVSGNWQVQDMLLPINCWCWFEIQTKVSCWRKTPEKSIGYKYKFKYMQPYTAVKVCSKYILTYNFFSLYRTTKRICDWKKKDDCFNNSVGHEVENTIRDSHSGYCMRQLWFHLIIESNQ